MMSRNHPDNPEVVKANVMVWVILSLVLSLLILVTGGCRTMIGLPVGASEAQVMAAKCSDAEFAVNLANSMIMPDGSYPAEMMNYWVLYRNGELAYLAAYCSQVVTR